MTPGLRQDPVLNRHATGMGDARPPQSEDKLASFLSVGGKNACWQACWPPGNAVLLSAWMGLGWLHAPGQTPVGSCGPRPGYHNRRCSCSMACLQSLPCVWSLQPDCPCSLVSGSCLPEEWTWGQEKPAATGPPVSPLVVSPVGEGAVQGGPWGGCVGSLHGAGTPGGRHPGQRAWGPETGRVWVGLGPLAHGSAPRPAVCRCLET